MFASFIDSVVHGDPVFILATAGAGGLLAIRAGVLVCRLCLKEAMLVRFEPHVSIAGVPYDFRIYSLILFGVLGVWAGINCLRASLQMINGNPESMAWRGLVVDIHRVAHGANPAASAICNCGADNECYRRRSGIREPPLRFNSEAEIRGLL